VYSKLTRLWYRLRVLCLTSQDSHEHIRMTGLWHWRRVLWLTSWQVMAWHWRPCAQQADRIMILTENFLRLTSWQAYGSTARAAMCTASWQDYDTDGEFCGLQAGRLMAGQTGQPCAQQADRIMTLTESFVAYKLAGLWLDRQDSHVHSKLTRLRAEERACEFSFQPFPIASHGGFSRKNS
jgi:hypothetical protein